MKLGTIVKLSFAMSFLLVFVGAYLKIVHSQIALAFLITGFVATAVFIVSAIYEVRTSIRIGDAEKNKWTIGLLFFSGLAGLIYIAFARKSIAEV